MRATRRGTPDSAARLRALTRRAYTATAGHLDLDDDAGREFDRIVSGEAAGREGGEHRAPRRRRWAVSGRAVLVVLVVAAALAGIIVARALALGPTDPVPVPGAPAAEDRTGGRAGDDGPGPGREHADEEAPDDGAHHADEPLPEGLDRGSGPGTESGAGGLAASDDTSALPVVVHVAGAVEDPGVVELPGGARVADAIDAVGGAQPDAELAAVNLARPVQDGEQVYVPQVGEVEPGTAAAPGTGTTAETSSGGAPGDGLVDLNTADLATLDTLPGVGPAIAQRILDWRAANGPFHSVDELLEVSGIGPATLDRLRERARV